MDDDSSVECYLHVIGDALASWDGEAPEGTAGAFKYAIAARFLWDVSADLGLLDGTPQLALEIFDRHCCIKTQLALEKSFGETVALGEAFPQPVLALLLTALQVASKVISAKRYITPALLQRLGQHYEIFSSNTIRPKSLFLADELSFLATLNFHLPPSPVSCVEALVEILHVNLVRIESHLVWPTLNFQLDVLHQFALRFLDFQYLVGEEIRTLLKMSDGLGQSRSACGSLKLQSAAIVACACFLCDEKHFNVGVNMLSTIVDESTTVVFEHARLMLLVSRRYSNLETAPSTVVYKRRAT